MRADDLLIGDVFATAAASVPHRTAVSLGNRSLTFGALDARADQMARALGSLGIGRGSRVALWSATTLEAVPLFAALAKLGAVFVPVNGLLGEAEAAPIFAVCHPDLVATDRDRPMPAGVPARTTLDQLGELADTCPAEPSGGAPPTEDDPHVVFFTSGTTGRPKGAILSHRANFLRSHPGALPEPRGAMVCPYPLFHMGAWTIALQQWQARDAVVLLESAGAEQICAAVARHRATRLNCVPAVWRRIIDHAGPTGAAQLATLRFADTGTSATPPELLEAIGGAAPRRPAPGVLRLHRGRWGHLSRARATSAASRAAAGWPSPGCGSAGTSAVRSGSAARSCSTATSTTRPPPPTASSTAGTAPATSPTRTTTASSASSGAPAT